MKIIKLRKAICIIVILTVVTLLIAPTAAPQSEEATEEPGIAAPAPPQSDHMALMVEAAVTGDVVQGREAAELRNEKIDVWGRGYTKIDFDDLYLLAKVMYAEAGSDWLTDEHQRLVGSVVLNRVVSPEFPNTMLEVLNQPGQYYGANSAYFNSLLPDERTVLNALFLLEHGSIAPASVVFQSNYSSLGSGVYKSIPDAYLSTTYFCYSSYPGLY